MTISTRYRSLTLAAHCAGLSAYDFEAGVDMINHELKCIYIHIQGTGGSSVERWLCGRDWWILDAPTKHILASQAKALYSEYWDDYFKFSIVRSPISRMISCLRFPQHFGLEITHEGDLALEGYHRIYGDDVIIEHDYRFYDRASLVLPHHKPSCVYGNILDEDLDFIGSYESYNETIDLLKKKLDVSSEFKYHLSRSISTPQLNISRKTVAHFCDMYAEDIERYGFDMNVHGS